MGKGFVIGLWPADRWRLEFLGHDGGFAAGCRDPADAAASEQAERLRGLWRGGGCISRRAPRLIRRSLGLGVRAGRGGTGRGGPKDSRTRSAERAGSG